MHRARLLVEMATKAKTINYQEKENDRPYFQTSPSPVLQELNSAPSTSCSVEQSKYYISPIRNDHCDFDDSDADHNFIPSPIRNAQGSMQHLLTRPPTRSSSSSLTSSSSSSNSASSSSSNRSDNEANNSLSPATSTDGPAVQSASEVNIAPEVQVEQKGRKRVRNQEKWKCKISKTLRSSGKAYQSNTKKQVPAKKMGPACGEKCWLNCKSKIDKASRQNIF